MFSQSTAPLKSLAILVGVDETLDVSVVESMERSGLKSNLSTA